MIIRKFKTSSDHLHSCNSQHQFTKQLLIHTTWEPNSCKCNYIPYKWPSNWVNWVITPVSEVITLLITGFWGEPRKKSRALLSIRLFNIGIQKIMVYYNQSPHNLLGFHGPLYLPKQPALGPWALGPLLSWRFSFTPQRFLVGGFNPSEKILVKMGIFPK